LRPKGRDYLGFCTAWIGNRRFSQGILGMLGSEAASVPSKASTATTPNGTNLATHFFKTL
jgi:hypothetical protein